MSESLILFIFALFFVIVILVAFAFCLCIYLYVGIVKEAIADEVEKRREEKRAQRAARLEENRNKKLIESLEFI